MGSVAAQPSAAAPAFEPPPASYRHREPRHACMSHAVAYLAKEPLLCVGEDFKRTDLETA
jgi:hypothetical protein